MVAIVGPEGSGKTCYLTAMAKYHHACGGAVRALPGYKLLDGAGNEISSEIDVDEIVTFGEELRSVLLVIDEAPVWFGSDAWNSVWNRIGAALSMQRRKLCLGIAYTAQSFGYVQNRIRERTHLLVNCWDLYHSPWGKGQGLERGKQIQLSFFDLMGFFTGIPGSVGPQQVFHAEAMWPFYDTYQRTDFTSGMVKVQAQKRTVKIKARGYQGKEEEVELSGDPFIDSKTLNDYAEQGATASMMTDLIKRKT